MSDERPPGWPFDDGVPEIPDSSPPAGSLPPGPQQPGPQQPGPRYEPPPATAAPAAASYEPPRTYEPAVPAQPPPPSGQPPPPGPARQPLPPRPRAYTPPPTKKGGPWKAVFIVLAALVVVAGACGAVLFTLAKPPVDAANNFLALVDDGAYGQAARSSCGVSEAQLTDVFANRDITYDLKSSNVSNGTLATVSGSLTMPNTDAGQISLFLQKRGDDWRVCSFQVLQ